MPSGSMPILAEPWGSVIGDALIGKQSQRWNGVQRGTTKFAGFFLLYWSDTNGESRLAPLPGSSMVCPMQWKYPSVTAQNVTIIPQQTNSRTFYKPGKSFFKSLKSKLQWAKVLCDWFTSILYWFDKRDDLIVWTGPITDHNRCQSQLCIMKY